MQFAFIANSSGDRHRHHVRTSHADASRDDSQPNAMLHRQTRRTALELSLILLPRHGKDSIQNLVPDHEVWPISFDKSVVQRSAIRRSLAEQGKAAPVAIAYDMWEDREFVKETAPGEVPVRPIASIGATSSKP